MPRKAGAKLQHFHESNKFLAYFYLIIGKNPSVLTEKNPLKGCAGISQPLFLIFREVRREHVEHALMVGVKPVDFFLQKHLLHDGLLVDRTEGQRLKLKELAKLCFLIWRNQKRVLNPHTKFVCQIDARLVRPRRSVPRRSGIHVRCSDAS